MVSPIQNPPGAAAVGATGAEAIPEQGPSQAVIARVQNAEQKLATVTAKEPSEAAKQAAALRFAEKLQSSGFRAAVDEVATETQSPQKAQKLPPKGALHLLETAAGLGAEIPDWLKEQISTTQAVLTQRALTPQVELLPDESSASLDRLQVEVNKMLETPWREMDAKAAKEFCRFVTYHPDFLECCDGRSKTLLLFVQQQLESKFLIKASERAIDHYLGAFNHYVAATPIVRETMLGRVPSALEDKELCCHAYTLFAAKQLGYTDQAHFDARWVDVKAELDTRGLSAMLRYEMALCFGLMGICGQGYEASKDKEPRTGLTQILEYATRNAGATTE